jgi:hypothetical protein
MTIRMIQRRLTETPYVDVVARGKVDSRALLSANGEVAYLGATSAGVIARPVRWTFRPPAV